MILAFIDLETTGLNPNKDEIIEIGLILYDTVWKKEEEFSVKILPTDIKNAHPKALEVNGYNKKEWDAEGVSLEDALKVFTAKTKGTYFIAYNNTFDWGFLHASSERTGIPLTFDYHRLDVLSMAWLKIPHGKVGSWSLKTVCTFLGVPREPKIHRALNGARCALEVYKKLTIAV